MNHNRQVNRSKKTLESSIIKLLHKMPIDKITVTQLCEMSEVNRGTFYNHYIDIYDLLNQIENNIVHEFELKLDKHSKKQKVDDFYPLFKEALEFIDENSDVVTILLKGNEDSLFLSKIINLFKDNTINNWGTYYNYRNNINYDYFLQYSIHGCLGIINKWLKDGRKELPNDLARLLNNIVIQGAEFLK